MTISSYGAWRSPITAPWIAKGTVSLGEPEISGGWVWWLESRPAERGRQVVVRARLDGSERADAIGEGFSARTRVQEYGGGAYGVHGETLFFSNDDDGRVYRGDEAITPEPPRPRALRYADFEVSPDGATVYCVREDHTRGGEAVNEIVAFPADGSSEPEVIASGHDFFGAPRLSPDGSRLAWLSWDHPRMPWDGTELYVDGELVAGGPEISIVCPEWSPDGVLHWVSDETDWWNIYRDGRLLHAAEAEFAPPMWVFGDRTYVFLDDGRIGCMWTQAGFPHLGMLDPGSGELTELDVPYFPGFRAPRMATDGKRLVYVGGSTTRLAAVVIVDPDSGELDAIAQSADHAPDPDYVSEPEPLEYESAGGRPAHALYYRPHNPEYEAPAGEKPPLIVLTHGGPTAQSGPELSLAIQFWTSRGFAIVNVNYGGSTGYGRPYRELLKGQWGVVDVEDTSEAALHLARDGEVEPERLAIAGGSAGGWTTLCALAFTDAFHAGANYFGVADIEPFRTTTHKFESHYDAALVPPDKARERSPLHAADRITAALIVFQGLEDAIVPPEQSELIVAALERRGVPVEYHAYEGEGHGFRRAETIIDSLESEMRFYGRTFGFEPALGWE